MAFCWIAGLLWVGSPLPAQESPGMPVKLSEEELQYLEDLGPITVAPDPDWVPFEHVDEEGNFTGIAADLLDLVAGRLGITFSYVLPQDWDEALELSQAGEVLILPFLNQTPAREEWLIFTEPLLVDPNVFVTREEHPFISDALQLTDETIVFPSGTSMEERVRRDFPNLRVINVPSENDVFQAVANREADMPLRSLAIAACTIRKEVLFNLKIAGQAPREREEILNRHINVTIVTQRPASPGGPGVDSRSLGRSTNEEGATETGVPDPDGGWSREVGF